jgi:hypothetical protein
VVQEFPCRDFIFADSSDEVVEEEIKAQEPTPSVSSSSKENPSKEPIKEAPVVELSKKSLAEAKTKRRKKDPKLDLSPETHQASPSLSDLSTCVFAISWNLHYCD